MSTTYSMGCDQCGVCLWVGQKHISGKSPFYLYTNPPRHVTALAEFLVEHEGHPLRFLNDNTDPDWEDVTDRLMPPEQPLNPTAAGGS